MALNYQRMKSAVTRGAVWKTLRDYAINTGRVSFSVIGDSNGMHQDHGWIRGLAYGLRSAGIPMFGTGLFGARHNRSKYVMGGGGDVAWPRYTQATAFSGTATTKALPAIEFTGGTWTHGTLTLTKTGAFTNYVYRAGDRLYVSAVTSGTTGDYTVASRVDDDNITLTTSIGASASAVAASLTGVAGDTARSDIGAAFYRRCNIPVSWLPFGNSMAYHNTGTFSSAGEVATSNAGPIPLNGRPVVSVIMAKSAVGCSGQVALYTCTTAYGTLTSVGNTAYSASGGSDGDLTVARHAVASDSDRISATSRDWMLGGSGLSANDSGEQSLLFTHICNSSLNRGFAINGLLCRGGMSAYDMAEIARFIDTNTWEAIIYGIADQHASGAGGDGTVRHCIVINTGFNDAAESATSYDSVTVSSAKAGYKANAQDLMSTIRTRWNTYRGASADQTELYFMLMPSHCISDAPTTPGTANQHQQEAAVREYRTACAEIATSTYNTFAVNLQSMYGTDAYATLNDNRLTFVKDSDVLHLAAGGYEMLGGAAFAALDMAAGGRSFMGIGGSL